MTAIEITIIYGNSVMTDIEVMTVTRYNSYHSLGSMNVLKVGKYSLWSSSESNCSNL